MIYANTDLKKSLAPRGHIMTIAKEGSPNWSANCTVFQPPKVRQLALINHCTTAYTLLPQVGIHTCTQQGNSHLIAVASTLYTENQPKTTTRLKRLLFLTLHQTADH